MGAKHTRGLKLNAAQEQFGTLYASGGPGIRHNATACYVIAYPKSSRVSAVKSACALLQEPLMIAFLRQLNIDAERAAIEQMRDWKELAPAAQEHIEKLSQDKEDVRIMTPQWSARGSLLGEVRDVPAMRLQYEASKYILEQAYPKDMRKLIGERKDALSEMLNLDPDEIMREEEGDEE
jgi:hypothetical protein